jgi:hypothetical protein
MRKKFNFKDGDKVYCIQDILIYDGSKKLIKGKEYKIIYRDGYHLHITNEIPGWSMGDETFCLIDYPDDCKLFSEFFISMEELRKLKLKQLKSL